MLLYNDRFLADKGISEVDYFTDASKFELKDDFYYEVNGDVRKQGGETIDIGANASQEQQDEDESVDDVVREECIQLANLQSYDFTKDGKKDKKGFLSHMKKYLKCLKKKIEDEEGEEKAKAFQEKAQKFIKDVIIPNFNNWDIYVHEKSLEHDCGDDDDSFAVMLVFCNYRDDGVSQYFLYMKDGLKLEKV